MGMQTTGLSVGYSCKMTYVPTAIYHLLDKANHPLLIYKLKNWALSTIPVRITSFIDGYSAKAIDELEIDEESEQVVQQLPALLPKEIQPITKLSRALLNVLVERIDTGLVETHYTEPIWLLPYHSVPLELTDPSTAKIVDLSHYLGAFVTPNAPAIQRFLQFAVKYHPGERIYSYQRETLPQVKAIFDALKHDSQISYINSIVIFNPEESPKLQRIRLPRESLEERIANSVDGTLLFASLLEAASFNPAIVIVPGHTFVGWQNQPDTDEWNYLETTMIATNTFEEAMDIGNRKAKAFSSVAVKNPFVFRRWSLHDLRTKYHITPVE